MGWKLLGLGINRNYSENPNQIFDILGIKEPKLKKNIDFETAYSKFWEDDNIAIGFFENGTLLFCNIDLMVDDNLLRKASINKQIIAYYIYEITGTYCFDYFDNGKYIRKNWFSDSDKNIDGSDNFGNKLDGEKNDDHLENILNLIGKTIDQNFLKIEENYKFQHYKVKFGEPIFEPQKSKNFFKRLFG